MPEKLFRGKRWIGPTLKSLKCFATYATEKVPVEEGKKGGPQPIVLKKWFAEEWVHSVTPDAYIHLDWPHLILGSEEFDDKVRPFSGTDTTSRLVKANDAIKAAIIKYVPGKAAGLYSGGEKGAFLKTHFPPQKKTTARIHWPP